MCLNKCAWSFAEYYGRSLMSDIAGVNCTPNASVYAKC